ncbi:hypothetical protein BPUTEOMOX_705 [methanotrophic endosymbiont of Bathymodiolus puteoserpentis (Logatchev)]|nr:hypothetical protein BPUTEOMOX_705 [methanotrophic endosymbiont of Bathymodiolus puteoserpentis (Logatchev)]
MFWSFVSQKKSTEFYQAYINKYGSSGLYHQLALLELNRLANGSSFVPIPLKVQLTIKTSPESLRGLCCIKN